jgi:hypothetical protein
MDPQKDNWSTNVVLTTWIMVGGGILGGLLGFMTVYWLSIILGKVWGGVVAIIILAAISFTLYKVVIE